MCRGSLVFVLKKHALRISSVHGSRNGVRIPRSFSSSRNICDEFLSPQPQMAFKASFPHVVVRSEDYMLALALQQEDASALASTSPNQSAVLGDEAVAMALQGEERGLLEQRIGRDNVDSTLAGAPPFREDRDRFVAHCSSSISATATSFCRLKFPIMYYQHDSAFYHVIVPHIRKLHCERTNVSSH